MNSFVSSLRRDGVERGLFKIVSATRFAGVRLGVYFSIIAALLFSAVGVQAKIGVQYQMLLGNPSNATATVNQTTNYLVSRDQYVLSYNDSTHQANWVSWNFTVEDRGGGQRQDNFIADPLLPSSYTAVQGNAYSGSGYDRGHMSPSADRTATQADNDATFYMTNMVPQAPDNNQGVWANFENDTRAIAAQGNEMLIISGPSLFPGTQIASGVKIPGYVWKIVLVVPVGSGSAVDRINSSTRVIAIKIPNIQGVRSDPWSKYITSIAQIEADTGFTFLTALPPATANALRVKIDGQVITGAPVISSQPTTQTVAVGGNATFSVTATGNATLAYQWFKGEDLIVGATSNTLTISNVQASSIGQYSVIVTNSVGAATSNNAELIVTGLPPVISTPPVAQTNSAGSTAIFTVTATGTSPFTYQWRKSMVNITGNASATTSSLVLPNVQSADIGLYDVVITNNVSSVTSAQVTLSVNAAAPTISAQPVSRSVGFNGTATFTVTAAGTAPLSYQWRKEGAVITGNASATTATLVLSNVQSTDQASYDVVVSNGIGNVISNAATLTVSQTADGVIYYNGGTYTQDFDSLPATGTYTFSGIGPHRIDVAPISSANMGGWSFGKPTTGGGTGANALFFVGTGSGNSGGIYSFGSANSAERALGSISSNSTAPRFGVTFVNNTDQTISSVTVNFMTEQWRRGNGGINKATGSYSIGASDLNTGTYINAIALDITAPVVTGADSALDGNLAANRAPASATLTGLTWGPGDRLVLRWTDINDALNDDSIAMDDFSFVGHLVAPTIGTQPSAQSATAGGNVTLNVSASGPGTLRYQWRKGTTNLTGNASATTASLTLTNVQPADAGSYNVVVTNAGGSVTSNDVAITVNSGISTWRQANFGTTANTGNAADMADPDGDGIVNQIEYALGLNPNSPASSTLPTGVIESGNFVFRFTRPLTTSDIVYTVQRSTDLQSWTTVTTSVESSTAATQTLVASAAPSLTKEFFRLNVGTFSTIPVGYMKFALAGNATSALGLPLEDEVGPIAGIRAGKIESFTATTLTNSAGGWTGDLANASAPWMVRITKGAAAGKNWLIASNTATTLTLSGSTLTSDGVTVGDTFEVVPVDTFGTLFGSTTLQGGASATAADNVQIRNGATWLGYFFDSANGYWRRTPGALANSNNVTLRNGTGFQIVRRGAATTLTFTGRVLGSTFRVPIANAGATAVTLGYPSDTTLGTLALHTLVSGWRSGTSATTADQVFLYNGTAWVGYVFNGTNWLALSSGQNSDTVAIPAGSLLVIQRPGSTAGTTDLVRPLIY